MNEFTVRWIAAIVGVIAVVAVVVINNHFAEPKPEFTLTLQQMVDAELAAKKAKEEAANKMEKVQ